MAKSRHEHELFRILSLSEIYVNCTSNHVLTKIPFHVILLLTLRFQTELLSGLQLDFVSEGT